MSEVKNLPDWRSVVKYAADGPRHHVLLDSNAYRAVLVGLEAGGKIPPHPSSEATYHFLEGSGRMIVDGESYAVRAGTTLAVPAGAARGVEAETRLAFLGSHGGHGAHHGQKSPREAKPGSRPMVMLGLMTVLMLVVMVWLVRMGASPMAMMLSGFGEIGLGVWGAMLVPMLGLLGMFVVMVFMVRSMVGMGVEMGTAKHTDMRAQGDRVRDGKPAAQHVTYTIPAISCGGCKTTIEEKVAALDGVSSVAVDVDSRQAAIRYDDPATKDAIESLLAEIGYPVQVE